MGFFDFVTNRWYRRQVESELEHYKNIKPPENPSRKYVDKLVHRLLDKNTAWNAKKELSMMGSPAVPALAAALHDARFQLAEWPEFSIVPAPLDAILDLLVPYGAEFVLEATMQRVESPNAEVRKTAAQYLASLGRAETIPILAKLLLDADGYVRSYVKIGIDYALSEDRADKDFRRQAYDLLLAQCDQNWSEASNDSPETIIALDSARAAVDFADARWLSAANPNVHRIAVSRGTLNYP
jgi:HEAT repeat protein